MDFGFGFGFAGQQEVTTGGGDPLAGIPFALRLQTHNGNNVPLGLYQDTACTIPATMDGDLIAGIQWVFASGNLRLTQSDPQCQAMLVFFDGVPAIYPDGVDDFYESSSVTLSTAVSIFALAARPWTNRSNYHALIAHGLVDAGNSGVKIAITGPGALDWIAGDILGFGDGSDVVQSPRAIGPVPVLSDDGFHVITIRLGVGIANIRLDGSSISSRIENSGVLPSEAGAYYVGANFQGAGQQWDGPIIAILVTEQIISGTDLNLIEAYLATLKP